MALFRRRTSTGPLDPAAFEALTTHARKLLPGVELDPDTGDLLVPVPEGRARIATRTLAEQLSDAPDTAHNEVIRRWLADVAGELATVTSPDFRDHADSAHDLASMRLRITPAWDAAAAANVISEPIPTAFTATVVVPIADRFTYLTPDRAEQLGGRDTVLHAAITNTITQELSDLDIRSQGLPDGHVVQAIAKDGSPYVTTCLLSVEQFLPEGAVDALVIAPRYSMVATYHLTREADITVAVALAGIAARLHDDADDPCIDGVYWWHEATLHTLDIAEDGTVEIPPQLAEAVDRLP